MKTLDALPLQLPTSEPYYLHAAGEAPGGSAALLGAAPLGAGGDNAA